MKRPRFVPVLLLVSAAVLAQEVPQSRAMEPTVYVPRVYGDQGMFELLVGGGVTSSGWWSVGAAGRYFVWPAVAPGLEITFQGGDGHTTAWLMPSLRYVPLRGGAYAAALTAKGGRLFMSDHEDGWAAGGSVAFILMMAPNIGLELGYEVLQLFPGDFCDDLDTCTVHGPLLGVRIVF